MVFIPFPLFREWVQRRCTFIYCTLLYTVPFYILYPFIYCTLLSSESFYLLYPFIFCILLSTVPFYLLYPFINSTLLSTLPFYLLYPFIYSTLLSTVTYSPVDCWRTFSLKISWSSEIFTTLLVTWGSNKCESGSVCIWTSRIPPPPDPALFVWNRILPSSGKNSKKTLHLTFLRLLFDFYLWRMM